MREHRRDAVHAAHGDGDVARADLRAEGGRKGAEVRRVLEAQREEPAFTVERELSGQREPAPVVVGKKDFRARRHPFHRAAELVRGEHYRDVLGVGIAADAEASAHELGDDADPFRRQAGRRRKKSAHVVHSLTRGIDGENAACRAARSPDSYSKARLPGMSACSCGAPARVAPSKPIAAGRSRYSSPMSSDASWASAAESATISATGC